MKSLVITGPNSLTGDWGLGNSWVLGSPSEVEDILYWSAQVCNNWKSKNLFRSQLSGLFHEPRNWTHSITGHAHTQAHAQLFTCYCLRLMNFFFGLFSLLALAEKCLRILADPSEVLESSEVTWCSLSAAAASTFTFWIFRFTILSSTVFNRITDFTIYICSSSTFSSTPNSFGANSEPFRAPRGAWWCSGERSRGCPSPTCSYTQGSSSFRPALHRF